MHMQSAGQLLQPSLAAQLPSPHPEHMPMVQASPIGQGQSPGQLWQSSAGRALGSHTVSPQMLGQSIGQLETFSAPLQHKSPQVVGQSAEQLQSFSPGSQVPSLSHSEQSAGQLVMSSPNVHARSPQTDRQSPPDPVLQLMAVSAPLQQPSPQVDAVQSNGQEQGVSPTSVSHVAFPQLVQ
jgi:hypothetical protein